MGLVARAHGLQGEVVVDSTTDVADRFATGSRLTAVVPSGGTRPLRVESSRPFGNRLLVRFEGISTRTEAEELRGADLTIPRSQVRALPEGRHYRFELVGLVARTRAGVEVGTIVEVFSTGANDVLVIRGGRGEIAVPAIPGVVVAIDVPGGSVTVEPPVGLPGWDER